MKKSAFVIFLIAIFISCDRHYEAEELRNYKAKFDIQFTSQFPDDLNCSHYSIDSDTNPKRNTVGLYLYQKFMVQANIETVKQKAEQSAISKYNSSDNCLLVVNRFESDSTYYYNVEPKIDTDSLHKSCETKLLPIPNFINYNGKKSSNGLKLDGSFTIYVFEAKHQMLERYKMKASPQMPENWKNGYSKGVAISEKNKEVIYWSVAW